MSERIELAEFFVFVFPSLKNNDENDYTLIYSTCPFARTSELSYIALIRRTAILIFNRKSRARGASESKVSRFFSSKTYKIKTNQILVDMPIHILN